MEEKAKKEEIIYLECPDCKGEGFLPGEQKIRPCPRCGSLGLAGFFKDRYLVWQKKISHLRILEEKSERLVRSLINGVLIVFGLLGLFLGFWQVYQHASAGNSLTSFFTIRNTSLFVFWFSLLTDLYIYYRLEREKASIAHIERDFKVKAPLPQTLQSIDEVIKNKKITEEVSLYLTPSARESIETAWEIANRLEHTTLQPIHILASVIATKEVKIILARLAMLPDKLISKISKNLKKLPRQENTTPILSKDFNKMIYIAYQEAYQGHRERVGVSDLIIALARTGTQTQEILYDLEIEFDKLRNVVEWINIQEKLRHQWTVFRSRASRKPKSGINRAMTAIATPVLDQFSRDLTALARVGALPLSVGREKEIEEIFRILESGKGFPLLVGFPGTGKTSIIQAIASMMASEEVPEALQDKRLVSLSVPALVSGAGAMGELEERVYAVIDEVTRSGNIVLYIDNLQNMVGVSSAGGKTMDISEILTEALQKRYFMALASTNPVDFATYIERSGGLKNA